MLRGGALIAQEEVASLIPHPVGLGWVIGHHSSGEDEPCDLVGLLRWRFCDQPPAMFHVSQLDCGSAERFNSSHMVHVPLGDGRHLITLSGIVTLDYKSAHQAQRHSQTSGWAEEELQLDLLLPPELVAGGQRLRLEPGSRPDERGWQPRSAKWIWKKKFQ